VAIGDRMRTRGLARRAFKASYQSAFIERLG
jgi:hypothetical protein